MALVLASIFMLTSCDKSDEPLLPHRTILVYMAANNSLGRDGYDRKDIDEMLQAVKAGALGKTDRLLVFRAAVSLNKSLVEIKRDGTIDTLRIYDKTANSVDSDFMLGVFQDAKSIAPNSEYGLIMWSHAMGWTENGTTDLGPSLSPKTWGEDGNRSMNITTLGRVLKASPWDWIYFDCCFMGSVEVLYEIRNSVSHVVASATEVPLDGMPYDKNLHLLFAQEADLEGAAQNTFEYYDALSGQARTATIAVYDMSQIERLARATVPIYREAKIYSPSDFYNLPLDVRTTHLFYDFGVYMRGISISNELSPGLYENWLDAWQSAVPYYRATPYLWDTVDLSQFTGISTFIPRSAAMLTYCNYNTTSWYKDVARYLYDR